MGGESGDIVETLVGVRGDIVKTLIRGGGDIEEILVGVGGDIVETLVKVGCGRWGVGGLFPVASITILTTNFRSSQDTIDDNNPDYSLPE